MSAREQALAAMREPGFYPGSPPVEVRETHVSVVFLAGDRAYKVKKAVTLPFLDYGTLARRLHFCREEVRVNAEWAPGTYLGVRSLVAGPGAAFSLGPEDAPGALEYVVEMRRLPADRTLDRLIERGEADVALIERLGRAVASLHARADRALPGNGGADAVAARLEENLDTVRPYVDGLLDTGTFDAVARFARAFQARHRALMERRVAGGRAREGHGDLRAEHVVVEDGRIEVFDRIEFDRGLRDLDVAADLAFLVMDLERLGEPALAAALEAAYVAESGDEELRTLLPFYACYRAWVRGKVACLRLAQLAPGDPAGAGLAESARSLFALSLRFAWRARLPLVVVVCGVAACGKSSVAAALAQRSGLPHLSSDGVRKEMAGVAPEQRLEQGAYAPERSVLVYEELARRAAVAIGSPGDAIHGPGGAIVDATFMRREYRALLAGPVGPTGARVLFIECRAPLETLRERARTREAAPERGSDATWDVVRTQVGAFEPLDDVPAADRLVVRTDRLLEATVDEAERLIAAAVGF